MIRTSVLIPPDLYQQLAMRAAEEKRSVSELVRIILDQALTQDDMMHIRQVYRGLWKIHGKGQDELSDLSSAIDETLYGENGVWKGENEA
jgi:metal-responsive CopG/Arc/MetJ family transcriptional regulator